MTRCVIFDLDGTLADTSGDLVAAANACFDAMGLEAEVLAQARLDPVADAGVALRGGKISFDGLDPAQQAQLNEIPTRLKLKPEQVDMTIEAGRQAARVNPELNGFLHAQPGRNPLAALKTGTGKQPKRISPIKN